MSHYVLVPRNPRRVVSIGWDPPLANFFLQVFDRDAREEEGDPEIVWLGADGYATEGDVNRILAEAEIWSFVPHDMRESLLSDQKREGTRLASGWIQPRTS